MKGFTLNYRNSALLNHDSFSKIIRKQLKQIKVINDRKITRKKNKQVINEYHEKIFKLGYDERVVKKINEKHMSSIFTVMCKRH